MKISNQVKKQILQKLFDLFIIQNKKYLILTKEGYYITINTYEKENHKPLRFWQLEKHINNEFTIGTFSGYHSKFITFDIDIHDKLNARWATYYLIDTLIKLGIPEKYIYISTSGNKGYHVDIYFKEPLFSNILNDFYNIVMDKLDFTYIKGQIELRPSFNQGIKIPLGANFKNKDNKTNKCYYCDYENYLSPIPSLEYILNIEQIDTEIIHNIIEIEKDTLILDRHEKTNKKQLKAIEETKIYIDTKYKHLEIYENENLRLKEVLELEANGLKVPTTRHESLYKLCMYYKFMGCDLNENIQLLNDWMSRQDKKLYTTKINKCYKDIEEITQYIYEKDIVCRFEEREIYITYTEMLQILKANTNNERLLLYAMLIHNKRYAENNIFYMSYKQMSEATTLSERTCIRLVDKLEKNNFIIIVERNRKIKGTHHKKPNKYTININSLDNEKSIIVNNDTTYLDCIDKLVTIDDLRTLLPYRHFKEVTAMINHK